MTIKKVSFQFAHSSEENMMKCQPAECNKSAIAGDEDDFCAMSSRKSPTTIAPKRANPHTLRQNSGRRVSFFVPAYTIPWLLDAAAIQHRPSRTAEEEYSTIFEESCNRMEKTCSPPPYQPLYIPVRRYSNEENEDFFYGSSLSCLLTKWNIFLPQKNQQ
jgi:hypothetical protein